MLLVIGKLWRDRLMAVILLSLTLSLLWRGIIEKLRVLKRCVNILILIHIYYIIGKEIKLLLIQFLPII